MKVHGSVRSLLGQTMGHVARWVKQDEEDVLIVQALSFESTPEAIRLAGEFEEKYGWTVIVRDFARTDAKAR